MAHKLIDHCALPVIKFPNQDTPLLLPSYSMWVHFVGCGDIQCGFTSWDVKKFKCRQTYFYNVFLNIERLVQRDHEKSSEPIIY